MQVSINVDDNEDVIMHYVVLLMSKYRLDSFDFITSYSHIHTLSLRLTHQTNIYRQAESFTHTYTQRQT